jgi:hypothetical protein
LFNNNILILISRYIDICHYICAQNSEVLQHSVLKEFG